MTGKFLGSGTFSSVYKVGDKACKIYEFDDEISCGALVEVAILRKCQHKNIITLHEVISKVDEINLMLEYYPKTLEDLIRETKPSEVDIKFIIHQLLEAVNYLHVNGIMHRDIKPENVLIDEANRVKLIDFNSAKYLGKHEVILEPGMQSLNYRSPEILLRESYDYKIDVWSIGIIAIELFKGGCLVKRALGSDDALKQLAKYFGFEEVEKYEYPASLAYVPDSALSFVLRLADINNKRRMSAAEALQHEYLAGLPVEVVDRFNVDIELDPLNADIQKYLVDMGKVCKLHKRTVEAGICIMNRFMKKRILYEDELELYSFTCLNLACKLYDDHDIWYRNGKVPLKCELEVAEALNWDFIADEITKVH